MRRNHKWLLGILCTTAVLLYTCKAKYPVQFPVQRDATGKILVNPHPDPGPKSPVDEIRSIYLPKGYHLQLVASEPLVSQPVAIAWDGDGRMYVAEMTTYMKNVNGTGQRSNTCRIKLLEDTNGDGVMDKITIFADSLVLPRMILPLDHGRLLVDETYSNHIYCFQDTDGDGKADTKTIYYNNPAPNTSNLEHQKSGLIWNLDNRIYVTYDPVRYTYKNNQLIADSLIQGSPPQWGLANDNYGRLFFSSAGSEVPALDFQQNLHYGTLDFKDQYTDEFNAVWPIIATPDVQGGVHRLRADSTLNHFTACNGQSIYRGDKLPQDAQGDLYICEPVGRLIRRAKVTDNQGKVTLQNAYDKQEFLASSDMNFRPVNTVTGPDGCMYIVDMYHGIIQESEWTKADSYLRPQIVRLGLDKNVGRGRIFRVVYDGMKPAKVRPHMLEESSAQLVTYLNSPNGWWRDNAQKLLVLRGDKSVVPALKSMALTSPNQLARIHALWTLNGLGEMDAATFASALKDADAQVRKTTVWIGEDFMKKNDQAIDLLSMLKDDPSADVRFQLLLTMRFVNTEKSKALIAYLIDHYSSDPVLAYSQKSYEDGIKALADQQKREAMMHELERNLVVQGAGIFKQLCATCHGADAKGIRIGGKDIPAPVLAENIDVNAGKEKLIKILLYGLHGPIRGKTYPDVMPALGSNDNNYIASVLSYIRSDFGNKAPIIYPEDVEKIRQATKGRIESWTMDELNAAISK
ncbi:Glucose/arabinose dehydrogenase, beta-propeller fold [Mucilaginibacter mallensis]|uniref:Glucose/arabinose dehydrogenase, beta-propeller fold n=1 Tax=Mucilaginibacter mallensis TaxID=652787 RepID=A0A1H1SLM9_MUCMA|nr:c-type cytochrome [Mucilaginibacter mallensis]SDS48930.1 Glucose/arabinose dehydrogenase, beta-propeller fold [Mucilaginibacter mallensis]